jgi:hypothetical protein
MISIDEPLQPSFQVSLIEDIRTVRGKPVVAKGSSIAPVSSIDLSPVTAIPLAARMTDDAELANFIAAEKGQFRYDYVRLRCSFLPRDGERFEKGWLEVDLTPSKPGVSDPPVAWSMVPGSEFEKVKVTNSAKIGAKFKLITGEVSQSTTEDIKLYSIRGYREGGPQPFWEMNSNQLVELNGSLAFHLVVRSPSDVETKGSVKLSTMIGARKFWVFHSEVAHANEPVQNFVLPPVADRRRSRE